MKDYIFGGLGIILGIALAAGPIYLYGRSDGKNLEVKRQIERAIEVDKSRRKVDDKIRALSDPDICRLIGLPDDAVSECVRRLEKANSKP